MVGGNIPVDFSGDLIECGMVTVQVDLQQNFEEDKEYPPFDARS
jgi:hypothetical protein